MSVDGVNNNSNAGLYAAGAAVVGGGAGAAAGYYSRPFLKDGAPTDAFVKKMGENLKEIMSPEEKQAAEFIENRVNGFKNIVKNATNVEDLKTAILDNAFAGVNDEVLAAMKESEDGVTNLMRMFNLSEDAVAQYSDAVKNANTTEEFKNIMRTLMDNEYAGKTLEEIKASELGAMAKAEKSSAKVIFEQFWDSSKKAFVDCEEGAGKAIKKAAQSIQGKYALICGGIAAAAVGLTTLLCCGGKKAPKENVDTQA